jgi:hypothetical protein
MRIVSKRGLAALAVAGGVVCAAILLARRHVGAGAVIAPAQASVEAPAPPAHEKGVELEEWLFVQRSHTKGAARALYVLWIPQPIEKTCLGKTAAECIAMDYCIRTTSKDVAMCRNLRVDLKHLPSYPPDMRPRRILGVTYFLSGTMERLGKLFEFAQSAPRGTLDRLSEHSRFRARIRFTRSADDDDFDVLEILNVPYR